MKLWKNEQQRIDAQKIITKLLKWRKDEGWSYTFSFTLALRELGYSAMRDLPDNVIMQVLTEMHSTSKLTIEDFETLYEQQQRTQNSPSPKEWTFYIPIMLECEKPLRLPQRLRLLNTDFEIRTQRALRNKLGQAVLTRGAHVAQFFAPPGTTLQPIPPTIVVVKGHGNGWEDAWQQIDPAWELLRGIFEWVLIGGRVRLSNYDRPRRDIPHPTWMIAQMDEGELEEIAFETEWYPRDKPAQMTAEEFTACKQLAKLFRTPPNRQSTLAMLVAGFRLYTQALDARFRYAAFQGFWQVAETVTYAETANGSTAEVVKRLLLYIDHRRSSTLGWRATLSRCAKLRNEIVHQGIHNLDHEDVNIMKVACEEAIQWLIEQHKELPTKTHVIQFYRLREVNDAERKATHDVLAYLSRTQQQKPT